MNRPRNGWRGRLQLDDAALGLSAFPRLGQLDSEIGWILKCALLWCEDVVVGRRHQAKVRYTRWRRWTHLLGVLWRRTPTTNEGLCMCLCRCVCVCVCVWMLAANYVAQIMWCIWSYQLAPSEGDGSTVIIISSSRAAHTSWSAIYKLKLQFQTDGVRLRRSHQQRGCRSWCGKLTRLGRQMVRPTISRIHCRISNM